MSDRQRLTAKQAVEANPGLQRGGRFPCVRSSGVLVMRNGKTGQVTSRPAPCGSWECDECGNAKRFDYTNRVVAGWHRTFGVYGYTVGLVTMKFVTRRWWKRKETWDEALTRTGVSVDRRSFYLAALRRLRKRLDDEELEAPERGEELYKWFAYVGRQDPMAASWIRQVHFTLPEWTQCWTYAWKRILLDIRQWQGYAMDYILTMEFTKQGCPHIHACVVVRERYRTRQHAWLQGFRVKMEQLWRKYWPESAGSDIPEGLVHANLMGRGSTHLGSSVSNLAKTVFYVTKYIGKAGDIPERWQRDIDDGYKFRRYRKSNSWEVPKCGYRDKFYVEHVDDDGVIVDGGVFNWFEWESVKAKVIRELVKRGFDWDTHGEDRRSNPYDWLFWGIEYRLDVELMTAYNEALDRRAAVVLQTTFDGYMEDGFYEWTAPCEQPRFYQWHDGSLTPVRGGDHGRQADT